MDHSFFFIDFDNGMDHSAENPHSKVIGVTKKNNQYNTQILSALINERICNESYYNSRSKSAPVESNLLLPHTTNKTNGYRWYTLHQIAVIQTPYQM